MTDGEQEFSLEEQSIVQKAIDKSYQRAERDKINQTIHEARGLCWHTYGAYINGCGCASRPYKIPDYTSDWSAWGAALEWVAKQPWKQAFFEWCWVTYKFDYPDFFFNPRKGSSALAEFIDKHPEYFKKEEVKDE